MVQEIIHPQFSLRHAAFMVGVHPRTVRRWIHGEKLEAFRVGGRQAWYVDLREINRMRDIYGQPELSVEEAVKLHQEY